MYGEERKSIILEYVQQHSRASVQELSLHLQVSESTIRRDLKELEEAKLLNRTHGGAISLHVVNFEPTYREKEDRFRQEKEAIARKAAELVEEDDTILLDSGTTTFHLAQALKSFSRLNVVTNSLILAQELQGVAGIDVLITGGTLRPETLALVGPIAEQALDMIRVDKAFIAANGLDLGAGLTTPNLIEAAIKSKMIKTAKEVILLADSSKAGKITFAKFAEITEIQKCIIDNGVPESMVKEMRKLGIEVYVVQS